MFWIVAAALAQDPAPTAPATPPATPADTPPADAPADAPAAPQATAPDVRVRDEIDVYEGRDDAVLAARAKVFEALREEGYTRRKDLGDRTVFIHESPWHPQVIVYDDGWVRTRRNPIRFRTPGYGFFRPDRWETWVFCPLSLGTACISVGGPLMSERKLNRLKGDVLDATHDEVKEMNDAVSSREMEYRLNKAIPELLEALWSSQGVPAKARRAALFEFWDSRTDTPEGEEAKAAAEAFLKAVVQTSPDPFTKEELDALNATRSSARPLDLD